MTIYLKCDKAKGSSTTKGFEEQIELNSLQFGAGVGIGSPRGGDRTTSEPSVSEINISKKVDKASEDLLKALLKGESLGKVEISFTAASNGEAVAYLVLKIEEVLVSGLSVSSSGDFPNESVSLNFAKLEWAFTGRGEDQKGQPTRLTYDLAKNVVGA
jgi:type VI secretion system secreted protein Hcp